ncbi:MAG: hypothetical protein R3F34_17525 [Planctomycetota bacterium]
MRSEDVYAKCLEALHRLHLSTSEGRAEQAVAAEAFLGGNHLELADLDSRRRFLEWFLLERPSESLGEPPVRALQGALLDELAGDDDAEIVVAGLLDSRVGAFEVRDVQPGRGLWLHDLLGLGAYPVQEVTASSEIAAGDVAVGRVFAVGDGLFAMSPATALFRREGLVDALRSDAERLRASRRGTLRVTQIELESMFFPRRSVSRDELEKCETRAVELLSGAGFDEQERGELVALMRTAAANDAPLASASISAVLDRAAFRKRR